MLGDSFWNLAKSKEDGQETPSQQEQEKKMNDFV